MSDSPFRGVAFVAGWWSVVTPILFFLSGSLGFFYEVFLGHDPLWGAACALWAAGGPALVADRLIRSIK